MQVRILTSIIALMLVMISSCVHSPLPEAPSEAKIRKLLPGTWHSDRHYNALFVNGRSKAEKTFYADGSAEGVIHSRLSTSSVNIYELPTKFTSRWELSGNNITISEMRSQIPRRLDPKEIHYDKILSITPNEILYLDGPTGKRNIYKRGKLPL